MNKKVLPLLALVILISGCIGGSEPKVDTNNGLIVNDFSADPISAEATDAVRFFIDATNVGGTTATCVTTELYGVDSWRDEFGQPLSSFSPYYPTQGLGLFLNFADGKLNMLNFCYNDITKGGVCADYRNTGGSAMTGFLGSSFNLFSNQFCGGMMSNDPSMILLRYQPELIPPNPSLGRSGQSFTNEWILRPPVLPEGTFASYPITARTSYFYTTNALLNIQALSKAEYKRRFDLGQQTQFPLSVQNSFGPIQVFVSSGDSPVVVNPESVIGNPVEYHSYRFEFSNLGQGFPLPLSDVDISGSMLPETQSGFLFATLAVDGPGVFFSDCLGQSGNEIFIGSSALASLVKLRSDQRVPIGCTIGIDRTRWATTPVGTITFTFNLWYRYYIDRTINVNVVGVEGLSGPGMIGSSGLRY